MIFNKVVYSRSVVYKVNFPPFIFVRWGIFARRTFPYKTFHFIENYFCRSQTSRSRMLQSIVGTIFLDLVSHTIKEDAKAYRVLFTGYSVQSTVYRVQCTEYSVQSTVYRVQCTEYSLQSTVYRVQFADYKFVQISIHICKCKVWALSI
jgi:hypothetical protein